jgi:hypothetical protein
MYALGVSFLLATSQAFSPMGRVKTRMGSPLTMTATASPAVATTEILALVRQFSRFKSSFNLFY